MVTNLGREGGGGAEWRLGNNSVKANGKSQMVEKWRVIRKDCCGSVGRRRAKLKQERIAGGIRRNEMFSCHILWNGGDAAGKRDRLEV